MQKRDLAQDFTPSCEYLKLSSVPRLTSERDIRRQESAVDKGGEELSPDNTLAQIMTAVQMHTPTSDQGYPTTFDYDELNEHDGSREILYENERAGKKGDRKDCIHNKGKEYKEGEAPEVPHCVDTLEYYLPLQEGVTREIRRRDKFEIDSHFILSKYEGAAPSPERLQYRLERHAPVADFQESSPRVCTFLAEERNVPQSRRTRGYGSPSPHSRPLEGRDAEKKLRKYKEAVYFETNRFQDTFLREQCGKKKKVVAATMLEPDKLYAEVYMAMQELGQNKKPQSRPCGGYLPSTSLLSKEEASTNSSTPPTLTNRRQPLGSFLQKPSLVPSFLPREDCYHEPKQPSGLPCFLVTIKKRLRDCKRCEKEDRIRLFVTRT